MWIWLYIGRRQKNVHQRYLMHRFLLLLLISAQKTKDKHVYCFFHHYLNLKCFFFLQYKTFVPCFLSWIVPMDVRQTTHKDLVSVPLAFYWMHRTNSLVLVCGTESSSYSLIWAAWLCLVGSSICHLACHLNVYRIFGNRQIFWLDVIYGVIKICTRVKNTILKSRQINWLFCKVFKLM